LKDNNLTSNINQYLTSLNIEDNKCIHNSKYMNISLLNNFPY